MNTTKSTLSEAHLLSTHSDPINLFLQANNDRILKIRKNLQSKQQQCLDLLPLLLHINHSKLPAYLSEPSTPKGISNFQVSKEELKWIPSNIKQMLLSPHSRSTPKILSLFLIGSSGTIAHSTRSDFDLWICHPTELSSNEIDLLTQKSDLISAWAKDFNLEINCFLMTPDHFKQNINKPLSSEDCGSTQTTLLLDEFYRTAILLAGNIPAWWSYSNQQNSTTKNTQNRIDFGPIKPLEPGEFIGAGMWQLYKATKTPFKAALKLMLLEIYAKEYPNIHYLADTYKEKILTAEKIDTFDIDPYIMLYQRIESYLKQENKTQQLDIIRKCFYLKVGVKLSQGNCRHNERKKMLKQLIEDWGWTRNTLVYLDNIQDWTIIDVLAEKKRVMTQLKSSYQALVTFAKQMNCTHLMDHKDLILLNRKLRATFEKQEGKIDVIDIGLPIDFSHENIRLYEKKTASNEFTWEAFNRCHKKWPKDTPLKQSKSLIEVLLWCHFNKLIYSHLDIPIFAATKQTTDHHVKVILTHIRQLYPLSEFDKKEPKFSDPEHIQSIAIFINAGKDPLHSLSQKGLHKLSEKNDSLNFGAIGVNLILSLDIIIKNSWKEIIVKHFDSSNALSFAIQYLLELLLKQKTRLIPKIDTACPNITRPQAIAHRVKELIEASIDALYNEPHTCNAYFIFRQSQTIIAIHQKNARITLNQLKDSTQLHELLSKPNIRYTKVHLEKNLKTEEEVLYFLYQQSIPGGITIGFLHAKTIDIYLIDEYGVLLHFQPNTVSMNLILQNITTFLKNIRTHQHSVNLIPRTTDIKILKIGDSTPNIHNAKPLPLFEQSHKEKKCVIVTHVYFNHKTISYSFHFDGLEYQCDSLNCAEFKLICKKLQQKSPNKKTILLSDLIVDAKLLHHLNIKSDHSTHYLKMKHTIETKITQTLNH